MKFFKNWSKKKKIMTIISIIFIAVLLLAATTISKNEEEEKKELEKIKAYTSMDDFESLEQIAKYLDCVYIGKKQSDDENYYMDIFMKIKLLPFENNTNYRPYYEKLVSYCAHYLGYRNIRIIDESKNITIAVKCNQENRTINEILINGDANYFERQESMDKITQFKEVKTTEFSVESDILKKLVESNWKCEDSLFGTEESIFEKYKIYFDEGIQVRKVDNKVFNIIFNLKYKESIINGITTNFNKEEIINKLGEPTFYEEITKSFGYKGKNMYIFFDEFEKQVSIYPVVNNYDTEKFAKLIDEYSKEKDIVKFVNNVKNVWKDFDEFELTEDYVSLKYSLKGLVISANIGYGNGVTIYNNYNGYVSSGVSLDAVLNCQRELPDNIYLDNVDLVFQSEINKQLHRDTMKMYGNFVDEIISEQKYQSKLFYECKESMDVNKDKYISKFISIDGENPDSELKEYIDSSLWINDEVLVYGIKNKGIYIYNAKTRKYETILVNENEEFNIKSYYDGILEYDNKNIKLNV